MARIGIFDSGVGGLSVYKEIKKLLPNEHYIYFGDNANCPYGIKGPIFIKRRSCDITDFLLSRGAEVIIVACNTATSYAIEELRKNYSVPFLGTVPGVKPAAKKTQTGVIGVLATYGTLNAPLYKRIRDTWGTDVTVLEHIGEGFVELVESMEIEGEKAEKVVAQSVLPLVINKADNLVLGCTHYPFLKTTIAKVANRIAKQEGFSYNVGVYDPASAIARRLVDVLRDNGIPTNNEDAITELYSSGSDFILKRLYASL